MAKPRPVISKPIEEEPTVEPIKPAEPIVDEPIEEPVIEEPKNNEKQDNKPIEEITDEATKEGYLFKMSNKTYDFLKIFAAFIIPLIIREYPIFANIWGWGYSDQVINSLAELITIINAILYVSSVGYAKKQGGKE